jgi:mandelamide amidase
MLHGLPIPVKDSVSTMALPTSSGTGALRAFKPKDDADVVKRLLSHGAIVMGKTNLHELSFGWTSNNGVFGPVRNPYDPERSPGGSSGGSAVAVAARMAPLAVAEDTNGSIRVPASCCGVAGLRPTFGRYPNGGIIPLTTNKFDQVGPLARCVTDLALFEAAMIGQARSMVATPLEGVRIGVSPGFLSSGIGSEVEQVNREALRRLRDAGAVIAETEIPLVAQAAPEIASTIILFETSELNESSAARGPTSRKSP